MAARRTESGRARTVLAAAAALAAIAALATPASAGAQDAEFDEAIVYHTVDVLPDRSIGFTVTCPGVEWLAYFGGRNVFHPGPLIYEVSSYVRPYNRMNFVVRNPSTTATGRITVAVVCRRSKPKPTFKPSRLVLSGGNYFIDLQPGEQETAHTPCPAKPTPPRTPTLPGTPGAAKEAPSSAGRSSSSPAGLGDRYIDLEPGSPRARAAKVAAPPRLVDVVPTRNGFRVTAVGGDLRARLLLQALCLRPTITGRDADGDRVTRRVDVDRFSFSQTVRPGQARFGTGCPTGSAPLSTGYDLPGPMPVAQSFGRSPQATWSFLNEGSQPASVRLHLLCLPGRLVLVRGNAQVDTQVGPITVTQG